MLAPCNASRPGYQHASHHEACLPRPNGRDFISQTIYNSNTMGRLVCIYWASQASPLPLAKLPGVLHEIDIPQRLVLGPLAPTKQLRQTQLQYLPRQITVLTTHLTRHVSCAHSRRLTATNTESCSTSCPVALTAMSFSVATIWAPEKSIAPSFQARPLALIT